MSFSFEQALQKSQRVRVAKAKLRVQDPSNLILNSAQLLNRSGIRGVLTYWLLNALPPLVQKQSNRRSR